MIFLPDKSQSAQFDLSSQYLCLSIKLYLLMDLISVFNLRSCVKSHVICERHRHARLVYVYLFLFCIFFSQFRTSNVKRHPIQKHKIVTLMHFQLSLAHAKSTKKYVCEEYPQSTYESDNF